MSTAGTSRRRRGFSLVELAVVLLVLAALSLTALAGYRALTSRSHNKAAQLAVTDVLKHSNALRATDADRRHFVDEHLSAAADELGAPDGTPFSWTFTGPSTGYGQLSAARGADGSTVAAAMLSRAPSCVLGWQTAHDRHVWVDDTLDEFTCTAAAALAEAPTSPPPAVLDGDPPAAPGSLTATVSDLDGDGVDNDSLLSWPSSGEADIAAFNLYRCSGSGCVPEVRVATGIAPSGGGTETYRDLKLGRGDYGWSVTAVDTSGNESDPSNIATATVSDSVFDADAPDSPTGLAASAIDADADGLINDVELVFDASTEADHASYSVYRCSSGGCTPVVRIASGVAPSGSATETYVDRDRPDNTYGYVVTASDTSGNESPPSSTVHVVVDSPPGAPTGLTVVAVDADSDGQADDVRLDFDDNLEWDLDHYTVWRCLNDSPVPPAGACTPTTAVGTTTVSAYDDLNRPDGYWTYHVVAVDASGQSSWPSEVATVYLNGSDPAQPTNLTATVVDHDGNGRSDDVRLDFDSVSDLDLDQYSVWRCQSNYGAACGGSYTQIGVVSPSGGLSETYLDLDRPNDADGLGYDFHYQVRAVDFGGRSSTAAGPVTARIDVAAFPVTAVSATNAQLDGGTWANDIDASWTAPVDAYRASFNVYLDGALQGSVASGDPQVWQWFNVADGTYTVAVTTVDVYGRESVTRSDTVTINSRAPWGLTATVVDADSDGQFDDVRLDWEPAPSGSVSNYRVYRCDGGGCSVPQTYPAAAAYVAATVSGTTVTFTDVHRPNGTFRYRVAAYYSTDSTHHFSSHANATISDATPRTPVRLDVTRFNAHGDADTNDLAITWSSSTDPQFASFTLYECLSYTTSTPAVVGQTSVTNVQSGTVTNVTYPAGTTYGDVLVLTASGENASSWTVPAGFDLVAARAYSGALQTAVWVGPAPWGTTPNHLTVTRGSGDEATFALVAVRGATVALDGARSANGSGTAAAVGSLAADYANTLRVNVAGGAVATSYTGPGTEVADVASTTGLDTSLAVYTEVVAAGTSGSRTITSAASQLWATVGLTLTPRVSCTSTSTVASGLTSTSRTLYNVAEGQHDYVVEVTSTAGHRSEISNLDGDFALDVPATPNTPVVTAVNVDGDGQNDDRRLDVSVAPDADIASYDVWMDGYWITNVAVAGADVFTIANQPGGYHCYRVEAIDGLGQRSPRSGSGCLTGPAYPLNISDDFNRANGTALGLTSSGNAIWQHWSGSWSTSGYQPYTSSAASTWPRAVVQSHAPNADVRTSELGPGDAIIARGQDANNFQRLRFERRINAYVGSWSGWNYYAHESFCRSGYDSYVTADGNSYPTREWSCTRNDDTYWGPWSGTYTSIGPSYPGDCPQDTSTRDYDCWQGYTVSRGSHNGYSANCGSSGCVIADSNCPGGAGYYDSYWRQTNYQTNSGYWQGTHLGLTETFWETSDSTCRRRNSAYYPSGANGSGTPGIHYRYRDLITETAYDNYYRTRTVYEYDTWHLHLERISAGARTTLASTGNLGNIENSQITFRVDGCTLTGLVGTTAYVSASDCTFSNATMHGIGRANPTERDWRDTDNFAVIPR